VIKRENVMLSRVRRKHRGPKRAEERGGRKAGAISSKHYSNGLSRFVKRKESFQRRFSNGWRSKVRRVKMRWTTPGEEEIRGRGKENYIRREEKGKRRNQHRGFGKKWPSSTISA